jgi:type VI secretion system secreted protein Hcp
MAVDAFMWFKGVNGDIAEIKGETIDKHIKANAAKMAGGVSPPEGAIFNVKSYSFGLENVSTLSSQSGGAGGGKCNFNPLAVTKSVDKGSPTLFVACCVGTHIDEAAIVVRRAGGTAKSLVPYLRFWFKAVFITGVNWAISGDEPIGESVNLAYGSLQIDYWKQTKTGENTGSPITAMWNQVNNANNHEPAMNS